MKDYLPNIENIDVLNSASTSASIAEYAKFNLDKLAVTHQINAAVDCGQNSIVWQRPLSDEVVAAIKAEGYSITPINKHIAHPGSMYLIEWE